MDKDRENPPNQSYGLGLTLKMESFFTVSNGKQPSKSSSNDHLHCVLNELSSHSPSAYDGVDNRRACAGNFSVSKSKCTVQVQMAEIWGKKCIVYSLCIPSSEVCTKNNIKLSHTVMRIHITKPTLSNLAVCYFLSFVVVDDSLTRDSSRGPNS